MLNNNMRCFEITEKTKDQTRTKRLNNNMRCFEIETLLFCADDTRLLNNNMRCFEIVSESRRPTWNWVKQ